MNSLLSRRPFPGRSPLSLSHLLPLSFLVVSGWMLIASAAIAQEKPAAVAEAPGAYTPAVKLLPDSTAGLLRVPNVPKFEAAFKQTHFGQLWEDPSMEPFIEAQRERAKNYFESSDNKIGIRPEDLFEIATGEAVAAWLPFEKDQRRPYAICVVADIRGKKQQAQNVLDQIDKDLTASGATRSDITHGEHTIRVYSPKRKPGQLKIEQIAITLSNVRIIAADRDTVVTDLLDAIAGNPKGKAIETVPEFQTVLSRSTRAILPPLQQGGGEIAVEWYARPFHMARILREAFNVERGNEVDIVKLLENQGFDAVKAAGGVAAIAGKTFDTLHRGYVLAPPVNNKPSRYEMAARMLQFVNTNIADIPDWVHENVASFNRLHLKIEDAFWASETLIDEALGDEIFRPMIEGILKDKDGPQIDIENDVLPNLDDQVILLTDNTLPIAENSERMLVAIRVRNAAKIQEAIRKVMKVEPDTSKLDAVPGVEIWRVEPGASDDSFDSEAFGDLDLGLGADEDVPPPLLDHWAIALVEPAQPGSPAYLMFSSHPELLIDVAKKFREPDGKSLGKLEGITAIRASMMALGGNLMAFDRVVRLKLSLRAKYELLRQGKLKESDSVLAALYRRIFEDDEDGQNKPNNAAKLPPFAKIEKYLPMGGSSFDMTPDGWSISGFLLK